MNFVITEAQRIADRFEDLSGDFSTFRSHCSEVATLCLSESSEFWKSYATNTQGEKNNLEIYDDTAVEGLGAFAAIMESLNTPSHERWLRYQPARMDLRRDKEVQEYYDQLSNAINDLRYDPRANFQGQMSVGYQSTGAFGNKIIFTDGRPGGGFRYKACFIGDMVWDVNHQGLVDQVFRRFDWSNQQAYEAFTTGIFKGGTIPEVVQKEIDEPNPDWKKRHEYIHAVVPNNQIQLGRKDFKGMPYACLIIHKDSKTECFRSGYRSQPYAISRFYQSPNEVMGRSACMRLLPTIKTINETMRDFIVLSHKAADPTILTADDGMLSAGMGEYDLRPGAANPGTVTREGKPLVHAFTGGAQPGYAENLLIRLTEKIEKGLLVDVFNRVSQKDARMTAQEAFLRDKERSDLLGPIMGREFTEGTSSMAERELEIAFDQARAGIIRLPPKPQKLIDAEREDRVSASEYNIVNEAPIMRMQKSGAIIAMNQVRQVASELAQDGDLRALKMLDKDAIMINTVEASGAPWNMIKSKEQMQAEDDEERRQMELQQLQETAPAMAKSALDISKAQQIQGAI